MSIFKRLTNLAKGQAKVWSNGKETTHDAVFEAELRATRSADLASSQASRIKAEGAHRRQVRADRPRPDDARTHESQPIPRTDLFGATAEERAPTPLPTEPAAEPDQQIDRDPFATFTDPEQTWSDDVVDVEETPNDNKRSL